MKITGTQTESEDIKQEDTLSGAFFSLVRHAKNSKINTVSKRISQGLTLVSVIVLVVATIMFSLPRSARAGEINADTYSKKLHWVFKGAYRYETTSKLYWQLYDADGNEVTAIVKGGSTLALGDSRPRNYTSGIWCTTDIPTGAFKEYVDNSGGNAGSGEAYDPGITAEMVLSHKPGANAGSNSQATMPEGLVDTDAADGSLAGSSSMFFINNYGSSHTDADSSNKPAETVGNNDWIRGYATGEVDADGNIVGNGYEYGNAKQPKFELTLDFITKAFIHTIYTVFIAPILIFLAKLCGWFFSLLDVAVLFAQDLDSPQYQPLTQFAYTVATKIAAPYSTVLVALAFVFGWGKIDATTSAQGGARQQELMNHILMTIVALTLVLNAYPIFIALFSIAAKGAAFTINQLAQAGFPVTGGNIGAMTEQPMIKMVAELTYGQFFASIFMFAIMAFVAKTVGSYVLKVAVIGISRIFEVIAMTALAAVPLALACARQTRGIAFMWLRRYGARCALGIVLVIVLAATPLVFNVTYTIVSSAVSAHPFEDFIVTILGLAAPVIVATSVMSAIVTKADTLANAIFGVQ